MSLILSKIPQHETFFEDDFVWLKEAGVAIPTFNVDEPRVPLELATKANLFKLFLNDD